MLQDRDVSRLLNEGMLLIAGGNDRGRSIFGAGYTHHRSPSGLFLGTFGRLVRRGGSCGLRTLVLLGLLFLAVAFLLFAHFSYFLKSEARQATLDRWEGLCESSPATPKNRKNERRSPI